MDTNSQYRQKIREWFESSWKRNPSLVPLNKDEFGKYICTITAVAWESYLVGIASGRTLENHNEQNAAREAFEKQNTEISLIGIDRIGDALALGEEALRVCAPLLPACFALADYLAAARETVPIISDALTAKSGLHALDETDPEIQRRVAHRLCKWRNGKRSAIPFDQLHPAEQAAYCEQARDAIAGVIGK